MLRTKSDTNSPHSLGENVQKLTDDLFDLSVPDIHDDNLQINRVLCVAEEVVYRNFKVGRLNSFSENVRKLTDDLFDPSDHLTSAT